MLLQNFIACGELDPLNRRLGSEKKPDVVVQVVVLAQDASIKAKLEALDIHVQSVAEVAPIEVQPASVLSKLYAHLGTYKLKPLLYEVPFEQLLLLSFCQLET